MEARRARLSRVHRLRRARLRDRGSSDGIRPEFLRCRFKRCVRASVTSAVTPETWSRSLDDRLVDFEQGRAGAAVP
ncbi:YxiG-like protein [Amycolatopsis japonica]|uniref:YxiG-like protein n=1 Tax=Amycolatopsis japonica TaxID=208439 RepID=UPI003F4D1C0C